MAVVVMRVAIFPDQASICKAAVCQDGNDARIPQGTAGANFNRCFEENLRGRTRIPTKLWQVWLRKAIRGRARRSPVLQRNHYDSEPRLSIEHALYTREKNRKFNSTSKQDTVAQFERAQLEFQRSVDPIQARRPMVSAAG